MNLCIGWSYIPIKYLKDDHGSWLYNGDAILQKLEFGSSHNKETPSDYEIWMIVYGKPKTARDLIQYVIQNELEAQESKIFKVFCKPEVVDLLKEMGFKYPEDERFGVVLFEKILN